MNRKLIWEAAGAALIIPVVAVLLMILGALVLLGWPIIVVIVWRQRSRDFLYVDRSGDEFGHPSRVVDV